MAALCPLPLPMHVSCRVGSADRSRLPCSLSRGRGWSFGWCYRSEKAQTVVRFSLGINSPFNQAFTFGACVHAHVHAIPSSSWDMPAGCARDACTRLLLAEHASHSGTPRPPSLPTGFLFFVLSADPSTCLIDMEFEYNNWWTTTVRV